MPHSWTSLITPQWYTTRQETGLQSRPIADWRSLTTSRPVLGHCQTCLGPLPHQSRTIARPVTGYCHTSVSDHWHRKVSGHCQTRLGTSSDQNRTIARPESAHCQTRIRPSPDKNGTTVRPDSGHCQIRLWPFPYEPIADQCPGLGFWTSNNCRATDGPKPNWNNVPVMSHCGQVTGPVSLGRCWSTRHIDACRNWTLILLLLSCSPVSTFLVETQDNRQDAKRAPHVRPKGKVTRCELTATALLGGPCANQVRHEDTD